MNDLRLAALESIDPTSHMADPWSMGTPAASVRPSCRGVVWAAAAKLNYKLLGVKSPVRHLRATPFHPHRPYLDRISGDQNELPGVNALDPRPGGIQSSPVLVVVVASVVRLGLDD